MTATLTAVFRDGAFYPTRPVPPWLGDGAVVTLTIEAVHTDRPATSSKPDGDEQG